MVGMHATSSITLLCVIASINLAMAQSRATGADLTGIVLDQTGNVLPRAAVTAIEVDRNISRAVSAEWDGRFAILALTSGTYRVRAEFPGFKPHVIEDVRLALGAVVELTVILQVGGPEEQVTVTGAPLLVDPQKTAVSHVIAQPQINALPIDRRNFIGFTVITPGVTTDRIPQQTQGATPTSGLTFAGQRPRSNNVMVDGFDQNDLSAGAVKGTISQEAVEEFQVLANSYSAEFGKASGGIVNIVTKSGANAPHGNTFAFIRDDQLNGKGYFERFDPLGRAIDRTKAPFSQKQVGGILGGPIKRDKAFYFLSFERLDTTASNFVTVDDRTAVTDPFSGGLLGTPAQILRTAGFPVETGNVPYAVRSNLFLAKTDHQFTDEHRLSLRFNRGDSLDENTETFGGQIARSRAGAMQSVDYNLTASHTWILSGTTVNEARFQWADRNQSLFALDPTCSGECDRDDEGGPTLEVIGVATVGRQRVAPLFRHPKLTQLIDTFTHVRGGHQIKTGFDFNSINHTGYHLPLHFGGRYIFGALPAIPGLLSAPISSIQAVALGMPSAYVQGYGNTDAEFPYKDLSLFAQDDWRLGPRTTLKLGVRYQKQFWPNNAYNVAGYEGTYSFRSDNNNMAPRVAVAWDPTGDQKTSLHGSYGTFYDNLITAIVSVSTILDGQAGVRTLALRFPQSIQAWKAPARKLPESAVGPFPSVRFVIDPGLRTPFAHHVSAGVDRLLQPTLSVSADFVYVRGFNHLGTIDYNPLVPGLGVGRRPEDVNGVPGTSASILQYTSFGETWYRGLTLSVNGRIRGRHQLLASYTLSKSEDNSTDFQSAFVVQNTGRGRDRANPAGLPVGFNPDEDKGRSTQDQRHRLVLSGISPLPGRFQASSIVTLAAGRPFNILAGVDLNGDGDGGAFPSDRPRRNPAEASTSIPRNSGQLPASATIDARISRRFGKGQGADIEAMVEVFNLFNRTNFIEANNIFGRGAYPDAPLPAFGLFEQAAAPRQLQLGVRVSF